MTAVGAWDVALYVVAAAAIVWVLTPAIAFSLGATRLRNDVVGGPAAAEPDGNDPDYERRFRELAALGFEAAGRSRASAWFMSPLKWFWRSRFGSRWMTTPDGTTLAHFHRLVAIEPVRFGLVTVFDGGAVVETVCPGFGIARDTDMHLRTEYKNTEPASLLARHREHVQAFVEQRGRAVASATLPDALAADAAADLRILKTQGRIGYKIILWSFAIPALLLPVAFRLHGSAWHRAAIGICAGGAVLAVQLWVLMPLMRPKLAMQSWSASPQKPAEGTSTRGQGRP